MTAYYVLSAIIGILVGYLFFYLRYADKDLVDDLRRNLRKANKEVEHLSHELEEFTTQNDILKAKTTELLEKHDDMSQVITELSRYYLHIKKASAKSSELSKILHDPDIDLQERIDKYKNLENLEEGIEKKFF